MIKRFLMVITAAGLISALLLVVGTAVFDKVTPVWAAFQSEALTIYPPTGSPLTIAPVKSLVQQPGTYASQLVELTGVTVAELNANPSAYLGKVLTLSGVVTLMDGHEFLLNDGTGQIVVDVYAPVGTVLTLTDGMTVTISGEFEADQEYGFSYDLDTCLVSVGGVVLVDSCSLHDDALTDDSNTDDSVIDDDCNDDNSLLDDCYDDSPGSDDCNDDSSISDDCNDDSSGSDDCNDDSSGSDDCHDDSNSSDDSHDDSNSSDDSHDDSSISDDSHDDSNSSDDSSDDSSDSDDSSHDSSNDNSGSDHSSDSGKEKSDD